MHLRTLTKRKKMNRKQEQNKLLRYNLFELTGNIHIIWILLNYKETLFTQQKHMK